MRSGTNISGFDTLRLPQQLIIGGLVLAVLTFIGGITFTLGLLVGLGINLVF